MPRDDSDSPSRSEWRERLEARPLPGDASPPWSPDGSGYEGAAESVAHAFLVLAEERPGLLDTDDEFNPGLWAAFKERWPDGDDWLAGITGFQFGWAHNIVRYVLDRPITGNPAIMEVEVSDVE